MASEAGSRAVGQTAARYRFGLRLGEQGGSRQWATASPGLWPAFRGGEEILRFEDGSRGLVFDLQAERLGLSSWTRREGDLRSLVSHTGERLEIGVGDARVGRVIDPWQALDGGAARPDGVCALEAPSPPIVARDSVSRPLYTGIKVIDILIPIGRGQRQLIIGDSGTGKTSLALDSIISQAGQQVNCVYVSIGQKRSETALVLDILRHGALAYTTVVVAEATATPGMKYLGPFAGCAVAEG
jgi:F-type H+-transporting ATPase subunit alpha